MKFPNSVEGLQHQMQQQNDQALVWVPAALYFQTNCIFMNHVNFFKK